MVDAAVVSVERGLQYALKGKSAIAISQGEGIPNMAFERPTWSYQERWVYVDDSLGGDQVHAKFVSSIHRRATYNTAEPPPERDFRETHQCFYDRTHDGAQRAAEDIVAYLTSSDIEKPAGDGL